GAGGAVLKVDGRHGDDLRLGGRPGDEDVVNEEGVGVGEVVAADVDLELVGVGAVVGGGPGAGDGGPVVGVDGGVADPGERWFGDEPDAWGSGGALGEAGSHGEGVGDAGFEDSGRGLDAFEVVVAVDDAQRLAAFGEVDHFEGDVTALGPGAGGAVLKVDGRVDYLILSRDEGGHRDCGERANERHAERHDRSHRSGPARERSFGFP